ncbi:hypothetical protein Lfu02_48770 [Longispora fulva]|uniref:Uncharacterized protein n=1 Tax=Longispora fulva TaxID=619741 RepID=A0A8J7GTT1_9ACTN|nr:hypothetical protein [Longispora fulva]MBG6138253.1 hypothetical protein [Longispora fulva]GIG60505.1 hypothetical protein Lfu02_48770 [Longispora fulva]
MTRTIPDNADLGQLRAQAKELRRAAANGNPAALARVRAVLPDAGVDLSLRDAQLTVAREYGQPGWRELAAAVVAQQSGGKDLHRWFGVELNNGTWDVLDGGLSEHSPIGDREQALYAAYASTYHWMQVGTVANQGRGEYMIASVAVAIGLLDVAARHASRYAELIDAHPAAFADWDRAFAAEGLARVAARAGDLDAGRLRAEADKLAAELADPEDRRIVLERLARGPWEVVDKSGR